MRGVVILVMGSFLLASCSKVAPAGVRSPVAHPSITKGPPMVSKTPSSSPPPSPALKTPQSHVGAFDTTMLSGKEFLLQVRTPQPGPSESYEGFGQLAGPETDKSVLVVDEFLKKLIAGKIEKKLLDFTWRSYLAAVLKRELSGAGTLTGWKVGRWLPGSDEATKIAKILVMGKGQTIGYIYLTRTSAGWKISDLQADLSKAGIAQPPVTFDPTDPQPFNPMASF